MPLPAHRFVPHADIDSFAAREVLDLLARHGAQLSRLDLPAQLRQSDGIRAFPRAQVQCAARLSLAGELQDRGKGGGVLGAVPSMLP